MARVRALRAEKRSIRRIHVRQIDVLFFSDFQSQCAAIFHTVVQRMSAPLRPVPRARFVKRVASRLRGAQTECSANHSRFFPAGKFRGRSGGGKFSSNSYVCPARWGAVDDHHRGIHSPLDLHESGFSFSPAFDHLNKLFELHFRMPPNSPSSFTMLVAAMECKRLHTPKRAPSRVLGIPNIFRRMGNCPTAPAPILSNPPTILSVLHYSFRPVEGAWVLEHISPRLKQDRSRQPSSTARSRISQRAFTRIIVVALLFWRRPLGYGGCVFISNRQTVEASAAFRCRMRRLTRRIAARVPDPAGTTEPFYPDEPARAPGRFAKVHQFAESIPSRIRWKTRALSLPFS